MIFATAAHIQARIRAREIYQSSIPAELRNIYTEVPENPSVIGRPAETLVFLIGVLAPIVLIAIAYFA